MELVSPPRSKESAFMPTTPTDPNKRANVSFSAPTQKQKRVEGNSSTFIMSNSSGKTRKNPRKINGNFEGGLMEDEESVLVASPFAYVTPPLPPRDEVGNTKTTKAMAKIVEDEGTPDSVIRKLSFLNPMSSHEDFQMSCDASSPQVGTVRKVRASMGSQEFEFPIATPSGVYEGDVDSSSDGYARFSLSMMDLNPFESPPPRGKPALIPDLLINCPCCGKQFISSKNLEDHSQFCRGSTSTLAQTSDDCSVIKKENIRSSQISFARMSDERPAVLFTESPALPVYMQRALTLAAFPSVAPLPMTSPVAISPSILASPTVGNISSEEDFLEEEISTFLECLKSDLKQHNKSDRSHKLVRGRSENSLFDVSSDEDKLKHDAPIPIETDELGPSPPLPSPIGGSPILPLLDEFQEASMSASFLTKPIARFGLASPNFGAAESTMTLMGSNVGPLNDPLLLASVSSSLSIRFPCASCGRRFASCSRQEKHEAICQRVFCNKQVIPHEKARERSFTDEPKLGPCTHCGRTFGHANTLSRHEAICVRVFGKGLARHDSHSSVNSVHDKSRANIVHKESRQRISNSRHLRVVRTAPIVLRRLNNPPTMQSFKHACLSALLECRTVLDCPTVAPECRTVAKCRTTECSKPQLQLDRSSLEFQYNLLREQIRTCSDRLRLRRSISCRDG